MIVPSGLEHVLSIDPEIMHGDLCFTGTRVPVTVLLDNLKEGMGLDEFLRYYPTVKRSQGEAVLEWEYERMREASGLRAAA